MAVLKLHDFHLMMDVGMKGELMDLDIFREVGSLSGTIVKILRLISPVIRREHKWGDQRESRYMRVCEDPNEVRDEVHAYLPENLYRELKLLHADLNVYSIAQLLRGFLRFFLFMVGEFGADVYRELKRLFKSWKDLERKERLTPGRLKRQLGLILLHLTGKNRLVNVYSDDFSPFWIFRL